MLVLPDTEPFDQILGALKFRMETILLPLEPSHVFHRHTERASEEEETKQKQHKQTNPGDVRKSNQNIRIKKQTFITLCTSMALKLKFVQYIKIVPVASC